MAKLSASRRVLASTSLLLAATVAGSATAGSLTYVPINPAFGGSPLNNAFLVGTAQIQNRFEEQGGGSGGGVPSINFPPIDIDLGGVGGGGIGGGTGGGTPPIIVIPLPNTPATGTPAATPPATGAN